MRELYQSAYTAHHSTETALLKVKNDICKFVDGQGAAALGLLDLSAAFDTTDHGILLRRLKARFGITDSALAWISSYLTDRKEVVLIGESKSNDRSLCYGVPQGSGLALLLFTLYTSELGNADKTEILLVSTKPWLQTCNVYCQFTGFTSIVG